MSVSRRILSNLLNKSMDGLGGRNHVEIILQISIVRILFKSALTLQLMQFLM